MTAARFTTALLAALLVACSDSTSTTPQPGPPPPAAVATVQLSHEQLLLAVGEAATVAVTLRDAGGQELLGRAVTWTSDALPIATIGQDGRVVAVAPGIARIIAASEGKSDTALVTVQPRTVAGVTLDSTALTLETLDVATLSATVRDASGNVLTGRAVAWTTSNANVATVGANGIVTAKGAGDAVITATSEGIAASATVVVGNRPASDLLFQRSVPDTNQVFTLNMSLPGAAPQYVNAGSVSFRPTASPGGLRIAFAVHMFNVPGAASVEDIYVVDRNGTNMKRLTLSDGVDEYPAFAPDASGRIAFVHQDPTSGRQDIWVMFSDGAGQHALTGSEPQDEARGAPSWSPDGQWIAYASVKPVPGPDRGSIWIMRADGTNKRRITSSAGFDTSPTWSPDGTRIAFSRAGDIHIADVATGVVTPLPLAGSQVSPAWSPDGEHFAFSMRDPLDDFGNFHIYTVRADGTDLRVRVRDVSAPFANAVSPSWIR